MGVSVALSASVFLLERPNARDAVSVVLQYRDISRLMNRLSLSYIVVRKHSHDENEWNISAGKYKPGGLKVDAPLPK